MQAPLKGQSSEQATAEFEAGIARREGDLVQQERFADWFAATKTDGELDAVSATLSARAAAHRMRARVTLSAVWGVVVATIFSDVLHSLLSLDTVGVVIAWVVAFVVVVALAARFLPRAATRDRAGSRA